MANEPYKFPDEQEEIKVEVEEVPEIEVIDDTPAADRNREPLPQEMVDDLEKDDLAEYSKR